MPSCIPFSAFMAHALYDPGRGYYSRRIQSVGARGDFSTSATLSPVLGQAVAAWLQEEAAQQTSIRNIIEIGAGTGELMETVRKAFGWWQRRRYQWHIVETSPVLKERQVKRLGGAVQWHTDLKDALNLCHGRALIYHNELLDAFPATLLQWHDHAWQEVYVTPEGREVLLPLEWSEPDRLSYHVFQNWAQKALKQRVEVHPSIHAWMQHWAPAWKAGAMLTVDYGDEFPALYHRRPRGTLRAYLLQQRLEGSEIYQNPGRQDITADINFSDYRAWAKSLRWSERAYGSQSDFILRYTTPSSDDAKASFILDPEGAGQAFKYVIHHPAE